MELRALTADEIMGFRNALIEDLRSDEKIGDRIFLGKDANRTLWNYGITVGAVPKFAEDQEWCGTVCCAMGRVALHPLFREEGFFIQYARNGRPVCIQFSESRTVSELTSALAHFLGLSFDEAYGIFWAGKAGNTPREIAGYLETRPYPDDQLEKTVVA